jgi:hypothetical protein
VLQRQQSKRSTLAAVASGYAPIDALSAANSSTNMGLSQQPLGSPVGAAAAAGGPGVENASSWSVARPSGMLGLSASGGVGEQSASRAGSLTGAGMDRASVVAAVMAKRGSIAPGSQSQPQQQQQLRVGGGSPVPGGVGSRGVSPVGGEGRKDRASIVAAVLAKHNLAKQ